MYRLNKAGFEAYLVGGSVRDLMLGGDPKDFDVATDATPEEVRALFKNSRIIGRRFRIVHVRFGREIIEVTTFRGHHDNHADDSSAGSDALSNEQGMLLRDNVYGSLEDDALRRDLTVNALYYSISDFAVLDFCNGVADLRDRLIRVIGNAEQRYREDPVRMLRSLRFAAKLDFAIEPGSGEPIRQLAYLLDGIASARLFDETLKLFLAGSAERTFELMKDYEVLYHLFPAAELMDPPGREAAEKLIRQALINTDERIRDDKPVTPAFIYAALLWPALQDKLRRIRQQQTELASLHLLANEVIQEQNLRTAIPRRFQIPMKEIWEMQFRLSNRSGRKAQKLLTHPRFRAGYDFLLLREQAGELEPGLGQWWTELQNQDSAGTQDAGNRDRPAPAGRRRRPRPRRRKSQGNLHGT